MKNRVLATILTFVVCMGTLCGCGNAAPAETTQEETLAAVETAVETATVAETIVETQEETVAETTEETATETETTEETAEETTAAETEETGSSLEDLEAIGDVEVDKGLFDVTLTIPKDYIGDTTQEKLDEVAKEKGYYSITLNDDGSATYVMTKKQHKEMLNELKKSIDKSLSEMAGSENYPNITSVTANDNYTSFTITTTNAEPSLAESFAVMAMYMYGGMYGIFAGEPADNIHVDYVNADSGQVISSADSKDAGSSE